MVELTVGSALSLPGDTVTQTLVVYGGKGMGKTNFGVVLAEELYATGAKVAVIDPTGVWWGLQHAGAGGGGLPVLLLGGPRGDLPIEPTAGAVVADLVVDEPASVVINVAQTHQGRMWSHGEQLRFVADYCTRLYERQGERRQPVMQIIDEAGRLVPQTIPHGAPDVARCVGAIERMVELGRNVGIGVTLITQRSARMNKSVSELAECMIAFRTVGPRSVESILDWFGEHVPKDRWKDLTEQLRTLKRGHALVVSPGWLAVEGEFEIRARNTYDSSSTPVAGERRAGAGAAKKPNVEQYRARLAAVVENAEKSCPKALQRQILEQGQRIRELERLVEASESRPAVPMVSPEDHAAVRNERERIEALVGQLTALKEDLPTTLVQATERLSDAAAKLAGRVYQPAAVRGLVRRHDVLAAAGRPFRTDSTRRDAQAGGYAEGRTRVQGPLHARGRHESGEALPAMTRAFLVALAQHPDGLGKGSMLTHAGYSPSGKASTAIAELLRESWTTFEGGIMRITRVGLKILGPYDPLPTGRALREHLLAGDRLSAMEKAMLRVLWDAYPSSVTKGEILQRAEYAPSGKASTAFGRLRRLGWVVPTGRGALAAAALFFER